MLLLGRFAHDSPTLLIVTKKDESRVSEVARSHDAILHRQHASCRGTDRFRALVRFRKNATRVNRPCIGDVLGSVRHELPAVLASVDADIDPATDAVRDTQ